MNENSKQVLWDLLGIINNTISTVEWDPAGISGLSTVRMIEIKAMLINAEKKLTKIMREEGYVDE